MNVLGISGPTKTSKHQGRTKENKSKSTWKSDSLKLCFCTKT